jgi:murein DD-endopeptidase MepM/ murein hydrolase activator NlpD
MYIKLPFFGEWYINQGNDGDDTHKGEWADAWDFVILNNELSQYKNEGNDLKDYYCYGQNVIATADGSVVISEDGIDDNKVGEINILKNWGNTVIIKHAEGLYSKLCHLQKESVTVKVGDNVHYGQIIGKVGNSGRSPFPHLHFQLQQTPYIGSKTLKYPLSVYLKNGSKIETFSYPSKGERVKPVEENSILKKAFNLMPGTKLNWIVKNSKGEDKVSWEVFTNPYNKSYIFCHTSKSVAWFQYDGVNFCFTHFEGSRKSLLYTFYQAAFKLPLINIESYIETDSLPINKIFNGWMLFVHDFTAPFFMYLKVSFEVRMKRIGSEFDLDRIEYSSNVSGYSFNRKIWEKGFKLIVNGDNSLRLENHLLEIEATCDSY